jgi:hypothetical protein
MFRRPDQEGVEGDFTNRAKGRHYNFFGKQEARSNLKLVL